MFLAVFLKITSIQNPIESEPFRKGGPLRLKYTTWFVRSPVAITLVLIAGVSLKYYFMSGFYHFS